MEKLNLGYELEKKSHQYLWEKGYLVFPRVDLFAIKVRSSGTIETEPVTDIDCLGLKYGSLLEKQMFIIDCKGQSERGFRQVIRNLGIMKMLNCTNVLIIRSSVSEIVQNFASKYKLRIMPVDMLNSLVKPKSFGSFSVETYIKKDNMNRNLSRELKTSSEIIWNSLIELDPFRRIKRIREVYLNLKKKYSIDEKIKDKNLEYLLGLAIQMANLSLADITGEIINMGKYHRRSYIINRLIGNIELKKDVFARLSKLGELITLSDPSNVEENNIIQQITPTYTREVIDAVNFFRKNASHINQYNRFFDYILHDRILVHNPLNTDLENRYFRLTKKKRRIYSTLSSMTLNVLDNEKTFPEFLVKYYF